MLLKNKKVAIIGAGPVGLTIAILLQQRGIDVTVYERDKDSLTRISGGTLDLHKDTGQQALKKAGLLEQYFARAIPMGRTIADAQGKILFSKNTTPEMQYDNPEINRNDLRQLLLESLKRNTVVWDRKLTGLKPQEGKWNLNFDNNRVASADLVIGANGGMSGARKYITNAEIEYTGTIILQGEVLDPEKKCTEFYQLCSDKILMTSAKGNILVANPRNGNILSYSVIFKSPEEWSKGNEFDTKNTQSIIAFLSNRCAHWHECYKQLFHSTSFFVVWPTRKISLDEPWKNNRPLPITLIGDAAHIMPPFAGQGVNTGLKDALILSDNLTNGNFDTIEAAIKNYEQQMIVYAKEAQLETSRNEVAMHNPDFTFLKFYQ